MLNGVYALSVSGLVKSDLWDYFTSKPWYYRCAPIFTDNEKNSFQQAYENTIVSYIEERRLALNDPVRPASFLGGTGAGKYRATKQGRFSPAFSLQTAKKPLYCTC